MKWVCPFNCNIGGVLDIKWKQEFENVYNNPVVNNNDAEFARHVYIDKESIYCLRRTTHECPLYVPHQLLNGGITVHKGKNGHL